MENFKHIKWTQAPHQAVQIYKPEFRAMNDEEIKKVIKFETEYKPFGYNQMLYAKNIATVFITR